MSSFTFVAMPSTDKSNGGLPASPIIFKVRGLVPDVHLDVYGTIIHVHSTVLKMHSHYFFSFLDAPGSAIAIPGTTFKYDWTTKVVDEGQDWQLVSNNDKAGDLDVQNLKGDSITQALAFYKLLCAIYSMPFILESPNELLSLTPLARFYAALPALSRSLSNVLPQSPKFLLGMQDKALELLVVAKELRNALLFKDCLILSLGPWENPKASKLTDPELKRAAINSVNEICSNIVQTQARIILSLDRVSNSMGPTLGAGEQEAARLVGSTHHSLGPRCLPCYYRALANAETRPYQEEFRKLIAPLWESNLSLVNPKHLKRRECYFLGVDIRDEELPWDQTQTDW